MSLKNRIQSPTPKWFKAIIKIALSIAAVGGAILGASETIPDLVLPHTLKIACQYMVVAGIAAAAVSKTAVDDRGRWQGFFVIGFLLLLTSCNKHMVPTTKVDVKDSIQTVIKYIPTEVPVYIAGDTVTLYDSVPCPDAKYEGKATSSTGRTQVKANITNGKLYVFCNTDSLIKRIQYLEKQTETNRNKQTVITKTETVKVDKPVVPKWCWWLLFINVGYVAVRILIFKYKMPVRL